MNCFWRSSYNMYCGLRRKTKHVRKKLRELRRCLSVSPSKVCRYVDALTLFNDIRVSLLRSFHVELIHFFLSSLFRITLSQPYCNFLSPFHRNLLQHGVACCRVLQENYCSWCPSYSDLLFCTYLLVVILATVVFAFVGLRKMHTCSNVYAQNVLVPSQFPRSGFLFGLDIYCGLCYGPLQRKCGTIFFAATSRGTVRGLPNAGLHTMGGGCICESTFRSQ
jgi:hypothetical protein